MSSFLTRLAAAGAALALSVGLPFAAQAQTNGLPSYATGDESIHGTVTGFDGKYNLTVHDARGFTDNVQLHDGTVINPTGLRLAGGMTVTIFGHANGSQFTANEIDTPYRRTYAYGYPYGPGPYPYPYYGGFYPAVGVGFHFR